MIITAPVPAGEARRNLELTPGRQSTLVYVGAVSEHTRVLIPLAEAFSRVVSGYLPHVYASLGNHDTAPFRTKTPPGTPFTGVEDGAATACWRPIRLLSAYAISYGALKSGRTSCQCGSGSQAWYALWCFLRWKALIVRHQVDGYICRDKSVDDTLEGLRWMLADADRLARMGAAAPQNSESRFGRERFARRWTNCLPRQIGQIAPILAFYVGHSCPCTPHQYQAPLFRELAVIDLTVFAHRQTAAGRRRDSTWRFEWDVDLLSGYHHRFLRNRAKYRARTAYASCSLPRSPTKSGRQIRPFWSGVPQILLAGDSRVQSA